MSIEMPNNNKDTNPEKENDAVITKHIKDSEPLSLEEVEKARKEVEAFVERNITERADPIQCNKCIDGRPAIKGEECEEGKKPAAFPGADLGIAMILLEQGMTAEEALKNTLDFLQENGAIFNYHSDTHHKENGIGCGHANAAQEKNEYYAHRKDEQRKLIELVQELERQGDPRVSEDILDGDHKEKAILIIDDPKESVRHYDPQTGEQYFVYDRLAHMEYIEKFAEFLQKRGYDIDIDALKKAAENQAMTTLALLGSSQGKPIFKVAMDIEGVAALYQGNAPVPAEN